MYSRLAVVNAQTGAKGESDLDEEAKLLYGNVNCWSRSLRMKFEADYGGEEGQKLGLLFPDEIVQVEWRETPWSTEELLS